MQAVKNLPPIALKIVFIYFVEVNFFVNFVGVTINPMANRTVKFYRHHFNKFFAAQTPQVKKKIAQILVWVQEVERLPNSILRNIENVKGMYEIRIETGGNIFRIFCCFDEGNLVVLFHAFQKKTQKTPKKEIDKAQKLMNEYFKEKENGKE